MVSRSRSGIRRTRSGIRTANSVAARSRSAAARSRSGSRPLLVRSRSRTRAAWNHLKRHKLAYGTGAVLLGAGAAGTAYMFSPPRRNKTGMFVPLPANQEAARKQKVSLSNLQFIEPRSATRSGAARPGGYKLKSRRGFDKIFGRGWESMLKSEANWKNAFSSHGYNISNWKTGSS